jgi:hypothetical protein
MRRPGNGYGRKGRTALPRRAGVRGRMMFALTTSRKNRHRNKGDNTIGYFSGDGCLRDRSASVTVKVKKEIQVIPGCDKAAEKSKKKGGHISIMH